MDEKPAAKRLVPAALQHIAAMYAGVVTPPLIIGQAVGLDTAGRTRLIAASLLIAGLATLLQTLGIRRFAGNRLPFVNAASSAGITPMLAIAETTAKGHQLPAIYGAVMVAGVVCLAVGPFFGKLLRFFPPLVTGVVITLIGVTLMPVPVGWAQGGDLVAVSLGAGIIPLAAPTFYADFPAWAQTVLGSGISAGALVAVALNLFFHHLGTRSTPRAAVLSAASSGSGTQIP
ncbi:hypothetical protein SNA_29035 [Streptomyces natalensis ATCC 27448]|uniref:Uracil permease n=1 Tax=Streptomyces natalensis ATCC 27448 TaxID=1240678 RepID=A0A0D7CH91_9ACTN|nr:hypothetical protein SNA_29035 [Streptomyces natalensis ATCC 27448]